MKTFFTILISILATSIVLVGLFFFVFKNESIISTANNTVSIEVNEIGIFYKDNGVLIPLRKGTGKKFLDRAIRINNKSSLEFYVNLPNVNMAEFKFGTSINFQIDGYSNDGYYEPIEAKIVQIKPNIYLMTPIGELNLGVNAIIFGNPLGRNKIYSDVENSWPFILQ